VPIPLEPRAELDVVVELAVLHPDDAAVFIRKGLVPPLDVDDAESPHPERDPGCEVRPAVVRTSMGHGVRHPIEGLDIDWKAPNALDLNRSADPAHGRF
jgi:hypothetical protein